MVHVEAAGNGAAAPTPGGKPVSADGNGDVFASIFAFAQRHARTENSSPYEGGARTGIASTARWQKQLTDTLSKSGKRTEKASPSRRPTAGKPSLSDRMRESAERTESKPDRIEASSHSVEKNSRESLHDDRAKDEQLDSPENKQDDCADANDAGPNSDTRTTDRVEQQLEQSVHPQQDTSPQAVTFTNESARNVDVLPVVPAPSTTGNAGVSAEASNDNGGRSQASVIPTVTATLSSKQSTDHQPDGNGSANVNQPAAEKSGEAPVKPGTSIDFQSLLDATARSRSQSVTARSDATVNAKNPVFGGINLDEAQSVKQLAQVVRAATNKDSSSMLLKLDPPELGQMRIDVRMHEQTMTLRFETQTQAGHDAVQSRLTDLRSALEQHGILVDSLRVELRPPAAANNPHDTHHQQQGSSGGDAQYTNTQGQTPGGRDGTFTPHDSTDGANTWTGTGSFEKDAQDGTIRHAGILSRVDLVA